MAKFEAYIECPKCSGTGIYSGMAEGDGAGVVCSHCKGTGCYHYVYEYEPFVERKVRTDIKRVYETNPGIKIGEGGGYRLEDFGGISYEEFLAGKPFPKGSEDRQHTCPAWWRQTLGKKQPDWCVARAGQMFSQCRCFSEKEKCWKLYDIKRDPDIDLDTGMTLE
jgi:hypothetical protein